MRRPRHRAEEAPTDAPRTLAFVTLGCPKNTVDSESMLGLLVADGFRTVGDLREALVARYGEPMERVLRSGSILVDGVVSRDPERPLGTAADVLPRFSGG